MLWRRRVLAISLFLAAAVGGLLAIGGKAHAQTVATGTLTISGDAGDFVTQGRSYSYSTSNGDQFSVNSTDGSGILIQVSVSTTDSWSLIFGSSGTLAAGTYTHAFEQGARLDVQGEGRGCGTTTGSFTVLDAVFGPQGYVQRFDATFVQHCEGGTSAARGEVHILNPPPAGTPSQSAVATGPEGGGTVAPSATAVGGGNSATGNSAAGTSVAGNTGASTPSVSPLVLVGVGVLAWALLAGVSLAIGLGTPIRRPVTRTAPFMRSRASRR